MNRISKKICMILSVLMLIFPVISASAYTTDDVVREAMSLIISQEGVYDTVLANDNGALSIGRIGWHATKALELLKTIVAANEAKAKNIIGDDLYNEIISTANWNYRILTASEVTVIKQLLATEESHKAQDDMAYNDIKGYISHGQSLGITDGRALIFFADVENQCGGSISERVANAAIAKAGSAKKVTLKNMYDASIQDKTAGSSPSRRLRVYNLCVSALGGNSNVHEDGYKVGKYITDADHGLRIRSGPGTNYAAAGVLIPKGTTVNVTQINGIWGKTTYNGTSGWICLSYAIYQSDVSTFVKGDADGDGKITASDARLTLRAAALIEKFSSSQTEKCDVDGDGKITASDARKILRASAKIEKL